MVVFSLLSFTQREDFPEEDSKRPHITLAGIELIKDALRSHPLQRQTSLREHKNNNT
jgi:hypothetical protein